MCRILIMLASFVLVLGLLPVARAADPSLIAWYQFEDNTNDSSNYANHATAYGGPLWVDSLAGRGRAIEFDGGNDYVGTGQSLLSNIAQFTLAGWVNAGNPEGSRVGLFGQNDVVEFGFQGGLNIWTPNGGAITAPWTYGAFTWHHIAAVGDGTSLVIYVDGQEVATGGNATASYGDSTDPFNIGGGGIWDASGNWFYGSMDDVRVYDRALTQAEIEPLTVRYEASNPYPPDGVGTAPVYSGDNVYLMLDYTPSTQATTNTAYFSDNIDDVISRDEAHCLGSVPPWPLIDEEAFVVGYDDDAIEEFARAPLVFGETYYWCVDEFDGTQPWPGEVWSFLAMGEKAWGPTPADDDIFVYSGSDLTLIWNLGDLDMDGYLNKVTYKVYFGTDETDLPLLDSMEPNTCVVPGTALDPDTTYYWRVDEIRRENSVPFPAVATEGNIWSFTTAPAGVGRILREWWLDIGGITIPDLTSDPRYPDSPDGSDFVTLFEGPTNWDDTYGSRIHGWLYVNATGYYSFWIATDDNGELWLSTDASPANATLISYVGGDDDWAGPRNWGDADVHPSESIYLEGGRRYYISALMKEGGGGDNIAVAWQGPDSGGVREVIPGRFLMGYVPLAAHKPNPANSEVDVAVNAILSWTPGTEETTGGPYTIHHVYVGSDATAVAGATTGSDEYMGVVGTNQYGPLSLSYYEQVYWRVDSEDSGTGTIYPSPVWTFKATYNPADVVDPHLKLWLKFDGDPCDSSGHGRDGTEIGGPFYVPGYDGEAISLDGIDDYVDIEYSVGISGAEPRTIAGWAKARTTAIGDWTNLFGFTGPSGAGGHFDIEIVGATDSTTAGYYGLHMYGDEYDIMPVDLEWHHLAATFDGVQANWYADGVQMGFAAPVVTINTPGNVHVGRRDDNTMYFPGTIDDVRIYDYVLNATQIATVMRINLAWAWNPNPGNGATDVARTPMLTWTPGDYATSHYVFFGTDEDALPQVAGPQPTASYNPGTLDLGTTHYWAIGEANAAAPPDYMDRGRTWKFTTVDYLVIDNMDAYVAYDVPAGPHIFVAWRDGKGDCAGSGNNTGANLLETTPALFATSQLMKYDWDNDGLVLNPCTGTADDPRPYYYSKIVAQVTGLPSGIGSNWTIGGVKALSLLFYGDTLNSINDPLWVQLSDSSGPGEKVEYGAYADESLADIQDPAWHEWLIDLNDFDVQLTNVVSIAIGIGDENATGPHISSGTLYIDDVRLYTPRCIPSRNTGGFADADYAPVGAPDCVVNYKELKIMGQDWAQFDERILPVAPDPGGLVASYQFENNANDNSPNGNHGTEEGGPMYQVSRPGMGMAIDFDGVDDYVDCGNDASLDITEEVTITAWLRTGDAGNGEHNPYVAKGDHAYALKHGVANNLEFFVYDGGWYTVTSAVDASFNDTWRHLAGIYDGTELKLYLDGELEAVTAYIGAIATSTDNLNIGRNSEVADRFFDGTIDDVRIYDYALTHAEVLGAAGMPTLYLPVTSPANISDDEPVTEKKVNFLDYAELMDWWGMEQEWPSW